ncbi:MAG: DUF222 domain-containing protein [Acidimicrobiia bacterium]
MFDRELEMIPPGLDEMTPGPALGAFLSSIDLSTISGYDRIVVLRAHRRMASYFEAQAFAAMASISDHLEQSEFPDDLDLAWEAAATEIRAALRLTRRAAESDLDLAIDLARRLPRVLRSLAAGDIDSRRARVLSHGTSHLEDAAARLVVEEIIADAPRLTTGELAARLRRLCVEADPETARERYDEAADRRRVVIEPSPEGTANLLGLDLPPDQVTAIASRINEMALSLRRAGDPRTIDQLRADVYLDILAGTAQPSRGGIVDLHVDLETLARLSEAPGDLGGYGPVIADIARQVAEAQANGQWRYTIFDPGTGLPIHDGTTRRRPGATQRRRVEARDRVCYFPGCRMPARQCDLDHRTPWAERHETSSDGLDAGCKHDHLTVRHALGWKHRLLPGGDHLWISPLGHRYTKSGLPP